MKSIKVFINLFVIAILLYSCGVEFTKLHTDIKESVNSDQTKFINLNGYKAFTRFQRIKSLYYNKSERDSLMRTEFQFFLIKADTVIFIPTLPRKDLFDKSNIYLLKDGSPNVFYFNHFYFGKVSYNDDNTIKKMEFENTDIKMEWNFIHRKDTLELVNINKFRQQKISKNQVKSFFENTFNAESNFGKKKKVMYSEITDYKGIGLIDFEKGSNTDSISQFVANKKIESDIFRVKYLRLNYCKRKKIKNLDFIFDGNYEKNYNTARFGKGRILYPPNQEMKKSE